MKMTFRLTFIVCLMLVEFIAYSDKPPTTALLGNFPNPFYFETWISYQLSRDESVTIRIFDLKGKPVRTLFLGNKRAGFYITKATAAYWNGKDATGRPVGSGIYLYKLQAGVFSAACRQANIFAATCWMEVLGAPPLNNDTSKDLKFSEEIPQKSELVQNYPNPFNPETWIPFRLAQDANVAIRVYNTEGKLIRAIALGNKPAGIYITKAKAAYWDGRNSLGEKVASGVYLYTLQAGEFRATRKMVIFK